MSGSFSRGILRCLAAALLASAAAAQPVMRAYFLPVGQAHSTLLEFSCGAALIDAGSQDDESTARLLAYLDRFFLLRSDLNKTLDLVLITHNHIDHTHALREIIEHGIAVKSYVDNGQLTGTGTEDPKWVRANAHTGGRNIRVREVTLPEVQAVPSHTGLTDADIDPINCPDVDPRIRALWGRVTTKPANWSNDAFNNKNNHSIVTRIDFGQASFLFMGDLEKEAISPLLDLYQNGAVLDADVYQVGHHGSDNGTTAPLLAAVTPKIAVIPAGNWDSGTKSKDPFNTYAYGHPRQVTLDLLSNAIPQDRAEVLTIMASTGSRTFAPYLVLKRIYSTAWDGVVKIEATSTGGLTVSRQ